MSINDTPPLWRDVDRAVPTIGCTNCRHAGWCDYTYHGSAVACERWRYFVRPHPHLPNPCRRDSAILEVASHEITSET